MAMSYRPKPNPSFAGTAVALLLVIVASFLTPFTINRETSDALAQVSVKARHAAVCACVACPGEHGGKCCCASAESPADGFAYRAVCDTAPDAATPASPIPPVVLPRPVCISVLASETEIQPVYLLPSHPRFVMDAPLPPDAPPRPLS